MKKIVAAIPIGILAVIALLIAWANLVPDEDASAKEENTKIETHQVEARGTANELIATAWNHWNDGGAVQEENMEADITFIAIRSIDKNEMKELGMEKEFNELQDITYIISGGYGRLTEDEKQIHYKEFEDKLYGIHSSLN